MKKHLLIIATIVVLLLGLMTVIACNGLPPQVIKPGNSPSDGINPGNNQGDALNYETLLAYAQELGFEGSLEDLINACKGDNAYEIARKNFNYKGTVEEWLQSLVGAAGKDGISPTIGDNGNWWIGDIDTGVKAEGTGYQYLKLDDGDYYIAVGSFSRLSVLDIPSSYNKHDVVGIEEEGFLSSKALKEVSIPSSIEWIGKDAFPSTLTKVNYDGSCKDWADIVIEKPNAALLYAEIVFKTPHNYVDGVCTICGESYINLEHEILIIEKQSDDYVVTGVKNTTFTEVTIPSFVTKIAKGVFDNCNNLVTFNTTDLKKWSEIEFVLDDINDHPLYAAFLRKSSTGDMTPLYLNGEPISGDIVIPDGVKSIGNGVFFGCVNMTSVTIPDSVEVIGEGAFTSTGITNAYIGNGVKTIDDFAFYCCGQLTDIIIPDSVEKIGDGAFMSCEVISEITIDSGVTTLGMHSFNECTVLKTININSSTIADLNSSDSRMLYRATTVYVKTGLEVGSYITDSFTSASSSDKEGYVKYVLKDSGSESDEPSLEHDILIIEKQDADYVVTGVKSKNFTEVTIPNFVTSIGKDAFRNCSGLTSITIPDSVTSIGYYAFYDCSGLTSVTIPDSVTSIGSQAFYGCSGLTGITVSENNSVYHSVDNCLIETATGALIKVCNNSIIPTDGSVTRIGDFAFSGCSGLTSITIPDSVTSIGWGAFHNCSGLTSITIPDSVTSIGEFAFYNCSGLTEVYITDLAKWCNIDFGASDANPLGVANPLCYAQNLYLNGNLVSNLIIPNSVTSIGNYVFEGCSGITSITIPDSVTNIGRYAFYYCRGLTSITIPDSVTSINYCAFNNCSNLKTVIIDSSEIAGLTSSDSYLLDNAKTVYVKTGLAVGTYITNAFKPCSYTDKDGYVKYYKYYKDNEEVLEGDEPDLEHDILNIVKQGDDYVVTGVKSMDFTEITIPDFVTVIGKEAFFDAYGNCKVRKITFGQNLKVIDDGAFAFCMDLISVVIPEGLERIGAEAFRECYKLIEIYNLSSLNITPGDETSYLGGIGYYARDVYTSLDTPSKLTTEGNIIVYADGDVRRAVAYIGDSDNGSAYLNNITEIGFSAFAMKSLKDIHIYNTTKKIEGAMLTLCNVSAIYYHGSCAEWNQVVIDDNNEYLLEAEMIFDTGHTYVDGTCTICGEIISLEHDILIIEKQNSDYVVTGVKTKDFTEITIPNYITKIGDRAFDSCSKLTDITIPNSITSVGNSAFSSCNGLENITLHNNIASIGNWAFANCSKLTSITIPTNISNIGEYTFTGCIRITNITIPESVINIDNNAFSGCTGLISINIGSNVKNMGNYTFCDCSGLTSITIPDSVTSIGDYSFANCTALKTVILDSSEIAQLESIDSYLLYYAETVYLHEQLEISECSYIFKNFTLLDNSDKDSYVKYVLKDSGDESDEPSLEHDILKIEKRGDDYVVTGVKTKDFTEVTIPNFVTSIGDYAFYGCSGLTSITIPDSVTSIGEEAFYGCTGLTGISIPFVGKSKDGTSNTHFGYIFGASWYSSNNNYIPSSLKSVVITGGTSIGERAFYGCSGLTSITIPDSVTSIGDYAFYACRGLTSVTIGNGVTSIGNYAFEYCYKLVEVYNLSSLDITIGSNDNGYVGYYALDVYTSLDTPSKISSTEDGYIIHTDGDEKTLIGYTGNETELNLAESITSINKYAFYNNQAITSAIIPDSVTSIGERAFCGCSGLTSITIPDSVTSIGRYAFSGCSGLTSVTIGSGVTSIGNGAFSNCSGLTSVTIGNGVTSIGEDAFYGCSGLTSVTIGNGVMSIGENAFWSCYKLVEVYNLSSLNITISSNDNGYVGYYALDVYTSLDTLSKLSTNEDGYIIRTDGDEKVLLGYTGNETELVLPSGIMSIYQYAFWGCSGLTSITIPDSVTSIGEYAFRDCSGLTAVYITDLAKWCNINFGSSNTNPLYYAHNLYLNGSLVTDLVIPNSVTRIGRYTFYGCSGLTSITIPDSVTSIGWYAFADCSGLTSITVAEGNSVYHSDGNCLIETATGTLIAGCKNSIIPTDGSVTSIGEDAFYGCSGLKNVVIDSDTIAVLKTPNSFFSNNMLLSYAETVYVKEGLEVGSYITDSFTLAESSDMDGYVKYVK